MPLKRSIFDLPFQTDLDAIPVGRYTFQLLQGRRNAQLISLVERALPQLSATTAGTFQDRYILGAGFPHVPIGEDSFLVLFATPFLKPAEVIPLKWPAELDLNALPKYRVVLERVDD